MERGKKLNESFNCCVCVLCEVIYILLVSVLKN